MKLVSRFLVVTLIALSIVSCKKKEDDLIIDPSGSKEHYFPLKIGNSWSYDASSDYTLKVTGKEDVEGLEYFLLENTSGEAGNIYARYDVNKLHQRSTINNETIDLLVLDEDAAAGDRWTAGSYKSSVAGYYSWTFTYTGELAEYHDSYTVNGESYSDVIEVILKTSITEFELSSLISAYLTEDEKAMMEEMYMAVVEQDLLTQHTFYAKGVGFIHQYSDEYEALDASLKSYTVQ